MVSKEAMKLAVKSLKELVPDDSDHAPAIQGQRKRQENAIKALQEALAEQPAQRKPLTDEQAHQTLLDMAAHIEDFGNENTTDEQLSGECIRFILERVIASGIKGKE